MDYTLNRKDLATIADAYRMREQARKAHGQRIAEIAENPQWSDGYKQELAQAANAELAEKVTGYNDLMVGTMKELINRVYNIPLVADNDFTSLLTFIRACGECLTKEQVTGLSEPYRGDMPRLKLVESVCKSAGVENIDLAFERNFYLHESNRAGEGNPPTGHSQDEFLKNWQETVINDESATFSYFFNQTAEKLGEDIQNPVSIQGAEMPKVL